MPPTPSTNGHRPGRKATKADWRAHSFRLPPDVDVPPEALAAAMGQSVADVVVAAMREYVAHSDQRVDALIRAIDKEAEERKAALRNLLRPSGKRPVSVPL